ncbi:lytic transglycosylase domain-containing protein [Bacillus sp. RAR_GA_16]|uniref:lytic transglycosylase domain-containing protein n=1 Tax=Bacillus sp. RAR_GA_16 TaxID=2876774 RepID=UPI001CC9DA13|nr:lytic transglycosylase domain-containing protein [Bacillus sp. RAR_GA_16]MCA0171855.1 lytic transglycosylase domain-containing protein [Bacillus sp. RAR_GA_16]
MIGYNLNWCSSALLIPVEKECNTIHFIQTNLKKPLSMITAIVLALVLVIVLVQSHLFNEQVADAKTTAGELDQKSSQNDQIKTQTAISKLEKETGYSLNTESVSVKEWKQAKAYAEQFYRDSDGKFNEKWGLFLTYQSMKADIDPAVVYELLKVETGNTFDPKLIGPETKYGHAYGMAQFMKNTAPWIADMAGIDYSEEKLFDPYFSITLSVTYLDYLYDKYGNWDETLTAYNRGIGGLKAYVAEKGTPKSSYSEEIKEMASHHEM